jgi:hypothetical protein
MHMQGPLANISVAYRNENYIADSIFPNVPVQKQADKFFVFDKVAWFRNEAGPRAPATRAVEGGYTLSSDSYTCIEVAFAKVVADEEEDNADDPLTPRRTAVEFATDKILLNKEKTVADLVFGGGSWAASATPSTTWDDPASDPISDIEAAKEGLVKSIGHEPNVCVMGREVWTDLKRHPDLLDLYKYTRRGMITLGDFQSLFEIPKVLVGTAIYASANELEDQQYPVTGTLTDVTVTYSFIWGKSMWVGYVPPSAALATPAAGYVFVWKGRDVRTFRREEEEATAYRVREHYVPKVTCSDAGYELIDCVA